MYISFYITDTRNNLVFQYLPSVNAPSFKNLWTRVNSACPELVSQRETGVSDGMNTLSSSHRSSKLHGLVGKDLEVFKYYSTENNVIYWCLSTGIYTRQNDTRSGNHIVRTQEDEDEYEDQDEDQNKDIRDMDSTHINTTTSINPFVFMEQIDQILLEYFDKDQLSLKKISNNYDQISLIFNFCLENGEPMSSGLYTNRIKSIVPMKSDFSKVINSTAHNISQAVSRRQYPHTLSKTLQNSNGNIKLGNTTDNSNIHEDEDVVPWRNNKYALNKNEFYIDMIERMDIVLEKRQRRNCSKNSINKYHPIKLINGNICGFINSRCYIGGTPFIKIDVNNAGHDLGVPTLHECVELDSFNGEGTQLNFIPPNGKFKLMEYNLDLNNNDSDTDPSKRIKRAKQTQYGLVSVDFNNDLGRNNDEFEISINIGGSNKVKTIQNLQIELFFTKCARRDSGTNGIDIHGDGDATDTADDIGYKIRILRSTHGRFDQSVAPDRGTWIFDTDTPTGVLATLRGCIEPIDKAQEDDRDTEEESHVATSKKSTGPPLSPEGNSKNHVARPHPMLQRVQMKYAHEGQLASGIQVDSIHVDDHSSDGLFKGVRYGVRTAAVELRCT